MLAVVGGVVGIPGVTDTLEHFLEPTFDDSRFADAHPSDGAEWVGLAVGGIDLDRRHRRSPTSSTCAGAASRSSCATASARVHDFLVNKWYFDELFDARLRAAGRHRRRVRPRA